MYPAKLEKDVCEHIVRQGGCKGIECEGTETDVCCPLWSGRYSCTGIGEGAIRIVQAQRWLDEHKERTE